MLREREQLSSSWSGANTHEVHMGQQKFEWLVPISGPGIIENAWLRPCHRFHTRLDISLNGSINVCEIDKSTRARVVFSAIRKLSNDEKKYAIFIKDYLN